jgi:hypothetical protein
MGVLLKPISDRLLGLRLHYSCAGPERRQAAMVRS